MAKALKPTSASPNKIQLRSLFMFPSFFCAIPLPRPDTLGTEKKSGVPYILTFYRRHRQTPYYKHDQKTRHVGLAHVAQPSYRACNLTLAKFSIEPDTLLRTLLGAFRACPAPRRERRSRGDRPTGYPRLCLTSLGGADGDGTPSLSQEATGVSLLRMVTTSATAPVVSGRWRVALRRAIASRKAVPADVKDQIPSCLW